MMTESRRHDSPAKPAGPWVVRAAGSIEDICGRLAAGNLTEDILAGEGLQLRVAVAHEKDISEAKAEIHDQADDIFYVLEGTALMILGGTLQSPVEVSPGEWRAGGIEGGCEARISKGDLVIVPRGTAHQRSTAGQDFSMLLIKVFAEPAGPARA